ncbi:hypothetical protein CEE37_02620 [candidate division LCP-89 bacterium B3_LCP]|uniref:Uncharacterized protein n=1 Tax=candidate division LCP-89 bacterium B3_LCP TaxID=2012998 RepID=A0A532V2Q8_UNCL8|nr:MAG: hypothetical protein CEE37_02620 [candidate division LCP-89 bacterium B3_LCP]
MKNGLIFLLVIAFLGVGVTITPNDAFAKNPKVKYNKASTLNSEETVRLIADIANPLVSTTALITKINRGEEVTVIDVAMVATDFVVPLAFMRVAKKAKKGYWLANALEAAFR